MKIHQKHVILGILGGLAALSLAAPPLTIAGAKDGKQPSPHSSASAVDGSTSEVTYSSVAQKDPKPGPAWKTIGGTVKHIKGDVYTVEDYEGNQVQLYVNQETKRLRGHKKPGDRVRAEITRDGFANSIQ